MSDITLNAPKLFDLSGQVAIVTGAGSGIGQRIAIGLAQCGAPNKKKKIITSR